MVHITRDRPKTALTSVKTFVENAERFGRTASFSIYDTSENSDELRICLDKIDHSQRIKIVHKNRKSAQIFAKKLAKKTNFDVDLLSYAILGDREFSPGANRNWALLEHMGSSFISSDDDIFCNLTSKKNLSRSIGFFPAGHLSLMAILIDKGRTLRDCDIERWQHIVEEIDCDFIGAIEHHLGPAKDVLKHYETRINPNSFPPGLFDSESTPELSQVLTVGLGINGDLGVYHPGLLIFPYKQLQKVICESESTYSKAFELRSAWIASTTTCIEPIAPQMSYIYGISTQTGVIPPFPPVGRGEDTVFGQLISKLNPSAYNIRLPIAVEHCPPAPRSFKRSDITMLLKTRFSEILLSIFEQTFSTLNAREVAEITFENLGAALINYGKLSGCDFQSWLQDNNQKKFARLKYMCGYLLDQNSTNQPANPLAPSKCENDFARIDLELLLRYIGQHSNTPKEEHLYCADFSGDFATNIVKTREHLVQFGELLRIWPSLARAAESARES